MGARTQHFSVSQARILVSLLMHSHQTHTHLHFGVPLPTDLQPRPWGGGRSHPLTYNPQPMGWSFYSSGHHAGSIIYLYSAKLGKKHFFLKKVAALLPLWRTHYLHNRSQLARACQRPIRALATSPLSRAAPGGQARCGGRGAAGPARDGRPATRGVRGGSPARPREGAEATDRRRRSRGTAGAGGPWGRGLSDPQGGGERGRGPYRRPMSKKNQAPYEIPEIIFTQNFQFFLKKL